MSARASLDDRRTSSTADALAPLGVLADPQRRKILLRLTDAALCTCTDLAAELDIRQPTVSHHLKVLRDAGLVRGERCGRFVNYTAVPERLTELADVLASMASRARAVGC